MLKLDEDKYYSHVKTMFSYKRNSGFLLALFLFLLIFSSALFAASEDNKANLDAWQKSSIKGRGELRLSFDSDYSNIEQDSGRRPWFDWKSFLAVLTKLSLNSIVADSSDGLFYPSAMSFHDKAWFGIASESMLEKNFDVSPFLDKESLNYLTDISGLSKNKNSKILPDNLVPSFEENPYLNLLSEVQRDNVITVGMVHAEISEPKKRQREQSTSNSNKKVCIQEKVIDGHWYSDDEINFLLNHYVGKQVGIELIDAMSLGQLGGTTLADNLRGRIAQLEVSARGFGTITNTLVLPVNLGGFDPAQGVAGNHWAALYINHPLAAISNSASVISPAPIITYIDPFGSQLPEQLWNILQRQYPHLSRADVINPNIRFQSDGYNCGPWIVEILREVVASNGGYVPKEGFDINAARLEHWDLLREQAPLSFRSIPAVYRLKENGKVICKKNNHAVKIKHDQRPTELEYALMSQYAYRSLDEDQTFPDLPGWKVCQVVTGSNSYQGVVFENSKTKNIVVAHRGTELSSFGNWWEDFRGILLNHKSEQKVEAYTLTKEMVQYAKEKDYSLSFAGHSLGAFLAELSVFFCHRSFHYQEVSAVTFESPGSRESLEELQPNVSGNCVPLEKLDIIGYVGTPNVINACNHHIGTVYEIKADLGKAGWIPLWYLKQGHSIDNIVKYFQDRDRLNKIPPVYMIDWPLLKVFNADKVFLDYDKPIIWDSNKHCYRYESNDPVSEFVLTFETHYQTKKKFSPNSSLPLKHFRADMQRFLTQFYNKFSNINMKVTDIERQQLHDEWVKEGVSGEIIGYLSNGRIKEIGNGNKFVITGIDPNQFRSEVTQYLQDHPDSIKILLSSLMELTADEQIANYDSPVVDLQEKSNLVDNYYKRDKSANTKNLAEKLKKHGIVAITGIAGAGKTQFANYYVDMEFRDKYPDGIIITIPCDSKENLNSVYRNFAIEYLGMDDNRNSINDPERVKRHVGKKFRSEIYVNKPFIMIFDGLDNLPYEYIESYFPKTSIAKHQQIIITSQRMNFFFEKGKNFYIDGFTDEEAVGFLIKDSHIQREDAIRLAKEFSNLPLGLQCAKMYIDTTKVGVDEYLRRVGDKKIETDVEEGEDKLMKGQGCYKSKKEGFRTQKAAITLSIDQLSPKAKYVLKCSSFFYKDRIFLLYLNHLLSVEFNLNPDAVPAILDDILIEFKNYSLLAPSERRKIEIMADKNEIRNSANQTIDSEDNDYMEKLDKDLISMHQIVQKVVQKQISWVEKEKILKSLEKCLVGFAESRGDISATCSAVAYLIEDSEELLLNIVNSLVQKGIDVNKVSDGDIAALVTASYFGYCRLIKLLLNSDAAIDKFDSKGITPLMAACQAGNDEVVKLLLDKGAVVDKGDSYGTTALIFAVSEGFVKTVNLLLDRGAEIDKTRSGGWNALMHASVDGQVEAVKVLLKKGADPNKARDDGATPLFIASGRIGNVEIVKLLINKGADVNSIFMNNWTPLMLASGNGDVEMVRVLLENGADLSKIGWDDSSALMMASEQGHREVVKLLNSKGDKVNDAGKYGRTTLMVVAEHGSLEGIKLLLEEGAEIDKADNSGDTALILAAENGHVEVVNLLLELGADASKTDINGWSVLMLAAQNGEFEVIKLLLDTGVDVNKGTNDGWTPLMIASQNDFIDVVELLLDNGADVNRVAEDGATALQIASQHNRNEIEELLVARGAVKNAN